MRSLGQSPNHDADPDEILRCLHRFIELLARLCASELTQSRERPNGKVLRLPSTMKPK
jgi:hypothetical protein